MSGPVSIVKRSIAHSISDIPHVAEIRNLASKIIHHLESQAMIHTYLRKAFGAKTRTIPIIFRSVGHYYEVRNLFRTESVDEIDLLPLFNYRAAMRWLETHGDDAELPQVVFGIELVECLGTEASELMDSMPAAPQRCFQCGASGEKPKKCAGCHGFWYCGKECQTSHWRDGGHKESCALYSEHIDNLVEQAKEDLGGSDEEESSDEEEDHIRHMQFTVYPRLIPGEAVPEAVTMNADEFFARMPTRDWGPIPPPPSQATDEEIAAAFAVPRPASV